MLKLFGAKPAATPAAPSKPPATSERSWFDRLKGGLAKTREVLNTDLRDLWGRGAIDQALYDDLEAVLLTADVGVKAADHIVAELKRSVRERGIQDAAGLQAELKRVLTLLLQRLEAPLVVGTHRPFIILVAGVNGAGKTTTLGKLARHFQAQGLKVMLAAGDTFRAAARQQLQEWGERNGVAVIAQEGGDPAAVIFDAVTAARGRGIDVLLADTAGRLATQSHLMDEIKKVKRVITKADPSAPHECLLVLDANTGQNALAQVQAFDAALELTGLVVTKLDGTAKGGVLAALAGQARAIPVRFIGVGEGIEDLKPFKAGEFAEALLA